METTDGELVSRYLEGDDAAFDELALRYMDRLYAFALRVSGIAPIAEDAVQDTLLKVWKNLRRFRKGEDFRAWVFSIARNATIDIMRKKSAVPFGALPQEEGKEPFEEGIEDDIPGLLEAYAERERAELVEKAFESLSPEDRSIVFLHDREGFTFEEIAALSSASINTVKSRHRRAVQKLRVIVQEKRSF